MEKSFPNFGKYGVTLVAVVVVGLIGFYLGSLSVPTPAPGSQPSPSSLPGFLSSKMVKSVSAIVSGKVLAVSGREVTLGQDSEKMVVRFQESATLARVSVSSGDNPPQRKEIKFSDLKAGENLDAFVMVASDGQIKGTGGTVFAGPVGTPQPSSSVSVSPPPPPIKP